MLVLSRFRNETIVIGSGDRIVEVTVVDIKGEKVRLGINAPAHVPVHRKEVHKAMEQEGAVKSLAKGIAPKPIDTSGVTREESQALIGGQPPAEGKKAC